MNRIICKTLTHRIGSIIIEVIAFTFIGYIITGQLWVGALITIIGQILSMIWYYIHEYLWNLFPSHKDKQALVDHVLRRSYEKYFDTIIGGD